MNRIRYAVATVLIALTTWYYALVRPPDAAEQEDDEMTQPISPAYAVTSVYDSMKDELEARKQAALKAAREAAQQRRLDEIAKQQAEAERRKQAAHAEPKRQPAVSRGSNYVGQAQTFEATAYTAYCAGCTGITRTGHDLRASVYEDGRRVIATDPRVVPLGSIVRVTLADGTTFEAVASDTGGLIKGAIIDIAHETKAEARQFGRQTVEVRMIRRGGR